MAAAAATAAAATTLANEWLVLVRSLCMVDELLGDTELVVDEEFGCNIVVFVAE